MHAALVLTAILALAGAGCTGGDSTAKAAAESFLDDHYVRIHLADSLEYTADLARQKVEKEMELAHESSIDAETAKPHISYTQKLAREEKDRATFEYELLIRPEGMEPFNRLVLLTVRSVDKGWRVTNFSEKSN